MNAPTINPATFLREEIRAGRHTTVTTGLAPGHVQAISSSCPRTGPRSSPSFVPRTQSRVR